MCHDPPLLVAASSFLELIREEIKVRNMESRNREVFLEGLKKYHDRGVRIVIEKKEALPEEWDQVFKVSEDGGFYMGDYISDDEGRLTEIRFDWVYNN